MSVLVKFYFGIFRKNNVLLAFCSYCFDFGAVALIASFFPFGVLDRRCCVIYLFLTIAFLSLQVYSEDSDKTVQMHSLISLRRAHMQFCREC